MPLKRNIPTRQRICAIIIFDFSKPKSPNVSLNSPPAPNISRIREPKCLMHRLLTALSPMPAEALSTHSGSPNSASRNPSGRGKVTQSPLWARLVPWFDPLGLSQTSWDQQLLRDLLWFRLGRRFNIVTCQLFQYGLYLPSVSLSVGYSAYMKKSTTIWCPNPYQDWWSPLPNRTLLISCHSNINLSIPKRDTHLPILETCCPRHIFNNFLGCQNLQFLSDDQVVPYHQNLLHLELSGDQDNLRS